MHKKEQLKEQHLKKRLTIMAALAFVFAILAVVCSIIGFSAEPQKKSIVPVKEVTVPWDKSETEIFTEEETSSETSDDTSPIPYTTPSETKPKKQKAKDDVESTKPTFQPAEPQTTEPQTTEPQTNDTQTAFSSNGSAEAGILSLNSSLAVGTKAESIFLDAPENTNAEPNSPSSQLNEGSAAQGSPAAPSANDLVDRMILPKTAQEDASDNKNPVKMAFRIAACVFLIALITDVFMMVLIINNMRQHKQKVTTKVNSYTSSTEAPMFIKPMAAAPRAPETASYPIPGVSLGKIHDVGKRDYQQDSFGHTPVLDKKGILAILADGMGGLSDGEKVSQNLIIECLNYGATMTESDNTLELMLNIANQTINRQLGADGLRKSGSTIVSVLIANGHLHWLSVGDSRIYLFRNRYLSQVTRDHDLFQQWMPEILDGTRSLEKSQEDMEGRKLTSFIGMGDIRYVDRSLSPISLVPGDRILLMSDGIYGMVPDAVMENILRNADDVQDAANQIAACVAQVNSPYQDNYTLMILGYDPEL